MAYNMNGKGFSVLSNIALTRSTVGPPKRTIAPHVATAPPRTQRESSDYNTQVGEPQTADSLNTKRPTHECKVAAHLSSTLEATVHHTRNALLSMAALFNPTAGDAEWPYQLLPLVQCDVLPRGALPADRTLATAVDFVVRQHGPPPPTLLPTLTTAANTTSMGNRASSGRAFPALQILEATLAAMPGGPGDSALAPTSAAAALFAASLAVEHEVTKHSTKAVMQVAQRAAKQQAAAAAASSPQADSNGSGSGTTTASGVGSVGPYGKTPSTDDLKVAQRVLQAPLDAAAAKLLVEVMGEEPGMLRSFMAVMGGKPRKAVADAAAEALRAHREDGLLTPEGVPKKCGGIFLNLLKQLKQGTAMQEAAAVLPDLPDLRSYQQDVVGMVLHSWGLPQVAGAPKGGGGVGGRGNGNGALGGAGAGAGAAAQRYEDMANGWRGNWLISAPTGSGKTRMFIEVARAVMSARPGAVVVVVVPSVILTTQHATYFQRALPQLPPGTCVGAFNSDNPLNARRWWQLLAAQRGAGKPLVVVTTAQSFANALKPNGSGEEPARLGDVDLLVLDEAHHCKDNHPYATIMDMYDNAAARMRAAGLAAPAGVSGGGGGLQRVLAVTASPASNTNQMELVLQVGKLKSVLAAHLHSLDPEEDEELAAVLARPRHETMRCELRDLDAGLMLRLQDFAKDAAMDLVEALVDCATLGDQATRDKEVAVQKLLDALAECERAASMGDPIVTRLNSLGEWLARGRELAETYGLPHLHLCCRFLDLLRKAVELVEDAGFEGALPFLARKGAALCGEEEAAAGARVYGTAAALGVDTVDGDSCDDVAVRASHFVRRLLVANEDGTGAALSPFLGGAGPAGAAGYEVLRDCFASGQLQMDRTFPKYWCLMQYLQRYSERSNFHGMIFVKTRQAVFHVADMIRRTQQLAFVEVLELIGQGPGAGGRKRGALGPAPRDRHSRGMDDTMQQQVLALFKSPGRKVLIATSAAEEGMDVPACEFVVRYNAAATGIQLVQSRGRARQRVSEFVAILQRNTLDEHLHSKSRVEEANMVWYQRNHARMEQLQQLLQQ